MHSLLQACHPTLLLTPFKTCKLLRFVNTRIPEETPNKVCESLGEPFPTPMAFLWCGTLCNPEEPSNPWPNLFQDGPRTTLKLIAQRDLQKQLANSWGRSDAWSGIPPDHTPQVSESPLNLSLHH